MGETQAVLDPGCVRGRVGETQSDPGCVRPRLCETPAVGRRHSDGQQADDAVLGYRGKQEMIEGGLTPRMAGLMDAAGPEPSHQDYRWVSPHRSWIILRAQLEDSPSESK